MNIEEQRSAERLYKEVLERLDIKPYEIRLQFRDEDELGVHASMGFDRSVLESEKRVLGVLTINEPFHELCDEEKKELIAHEIGHYKRIRNRTPEKVKQAAKLEFLFGTGSYRYLVNRNKERFVKWYTLKEIDADNQILEAFPGKAFLQNLKTSYNEYKDIMNEECKQITEARIANLEKRISEKEET